MSIPYPRMAYSRPRTQDLGPRAFASNTASCVHVSAPMCVCVCVLPSNAASSGATSDPSSDTGGEGAPRRPEARAEAETGDR